MGDIDENIPWEANGSNAWRTKERKISFVIEKVSMWWKLYNGIPVNGKVERYNLEDAAKKVNISKEIINVNWLVKTSIK